MTIRLLAAYGIYPCNAIVTLDSATEAGLIAAKQALADTTGGTPYVAPALPEAIDETKSGSAGTDSNGNVLTPVLSSHNLTKGITFVSGGGVFPYTKSPGRSFVLLGDSRVMANQQQMSGSPISVIRASGVVTVTWTAHAIKTGQKINVINLQDSGFLTDFTIYGAAITRISANVFTYVDTRTDATAAWGTDSAGRSSTLLVREWYGTASWWKYLNGFFGGGLKLSAVFGWGGATAANILANTALVQSVIASGATDVILDAGINDVVSSAPAYTSAQIYASIQGIIALLRAGGLKVWVSSIDPLASGYSGALAKNAKVSESNRLLKGFVARNPDVVYLNSYPGMVDPLNGTAGSGLANNYLADYIHFTALGARAKARKYYAIMSPLLAVPDPKITSNIETYANDTNSLNVLDAILMTNGTGGATTGSTGTVTGLTVATGLVMTVTGATAVCTGGVSAVRSDGFGYNQTFAFTANAANDQLKVAMAVTSPGTRLALTDVVTAYCELVLTGVSGSNVKGVYGDIDIYDGSSHGHAYDGNAAASAAAFGTDDQTYTISFPPMPVWALLAVSLNVFIVFGAGGTALSGTIGRVSLLKNEP